jgi:hypothetical protein
MCTKFWSESLKKGRDHLEVLGVGGRIILEWILRKQIGKVWNGCVWLRIWKNGGFF